ncbi:helix-turn-helix domain-containing protein [Paradesulfitobacterium ferrireducens]|uniref:helix-turn-helix domain-containing protein n=1 Tax=Paradesulfitobacterium ferrireducens TaxID=2816476 RepID=UPI001A904AD5|nr:helix-turn-helix transcriptional regulator [Paradesulfitobacterium ferrireducens]
MINVNRQKPSAKQSMEGLKRLGQYLFELRLRRDLSLAQVSCKVGTNASYLSEIEHGRKMPDDNLMRELAEFYGLDENNLFEMVGKVPLSVREELESNVLLQRILKEIAGMSFNSETKQELYLKFYQTFRKFAYTGVQ